MVKVKKIPQCRKSYTGRNLIQLMLLGLRMQYGGQPVQQEFPSNYWAVDCAMGICKMNPLPAALDSEFTIHSIGNNLNL